MRTAPTLNPLAQRWAAVSPPSANVRAIFARYIEITALSIQEYALANHHKNLSSNTPPSHVTVKIGL